ncbi:hypothetical protein SSX86_017486 [Deinandra increscens subsp. villosa]|uniref:Transmembrane protein n=1 Tax=Deinandra increscens subsp. villosa TaxID=3103831 RepID=A0AAP0GYL0_9ASTR
METPPPHRHHLTGILSDSERILTTNYFHFISLSFLFLPLSSSLITTTPFSHLSGQLFTVDRLHTLTTFHIFYILIVYLLSLSAIATITYTTYHGFSGQPVNFSTALKSLTSSFFPIVTTAITAHTLIFLISLTFPMLLHNLGFVIDPTSILFTWLFYVTVAITYFHVNWSLAFVVVVAESKSGVAALVRSSELVKGMRSVSLLLGLYFGFFFGISVWTLSDGIRVISDRGYVFFAIVVGGSGLLMSYVRNFTVATTVLYCYCKNFHGELAVNGVDVKIPRVFEA